jgi:riboflavin biosynthesis pyrimidine reductase
MVVTASGGLDPHHPGLSAADVPVMLLTTPRGATRLAAQPFGSNVSIEVPGDGDQIPARDIVALAARAGARVILCEGGPHLIGDLLAAGLLDELFLTVAPQMAGRDKTIRRLALVEGVAFSPTDAPWAVLGAVHRSVDHLFLRYDLTRNRGGAGA